LVLAGRGKGKVRSQLMLMLTIAVKKFEYVMGSCRNCGTERLAVSKDTPALNLPFE
jgi:hypothetical protein